MHATVMNIIRNADTEKTAELKFKKIAQNIIDGDISLMDVVNAETRLPAQLHLYSEFVAAALIELES